MPDNSKSLVASGYDIIAETYLERYGRSAVRDRWLRELVTRAAPDARVLDLGCGAGVPVTRCLTEQGARVVGVDISASQIQLARHTVPAAKLVHADMTEVEFVPESFSAVAAFYSITHVPRAEHALLLRRIATWLTPGGVFVASLGAFQSPDWTGDWLGVKMFFSHYDSDFNEQLVRQAGFMIEKAEVVEQDNEDCRFLWIVARRGR